MVEGSFVAVGEHKSHKVSRDNMLVDDARVTNYCITGCSGTHDSLAHDNDTMTMALTTVAPTTVAITAMLQLK